MNIEEKVTTQEAWSSKNRYHAFTREQDSGRISDKLSLAQENPNTLEVKKPTIDGDVRNMIIEADLPRRF